MLPLRAIPALCLRVPSVSVTESDVPLKSTNFLAKFDPLISVRIDFRSALAGLYESVISTELTNLTQADFRLKYWSSSVVLDFFPYFS